AAGDGDADGIDPGVADRVAVGVLGRARAAFVDRLHVRRAERDGRADVVDRDGGRVLAGAAVLVDDPGAQSVRARPVGIRAGDGSARARARIRRGRERAALAVVGVVEAGARVRRGRIALRSEIVARGAALVDRTRAREARGR